MILMKNTETQKRIKSLYVEPSATEQEMKKDEVSPQTFLIGNWFYKIKVWHSNPLLSAAFAFLKKKPCPHFHLHGCNTEATDGFPNHKSKWEQESSPQRKVSDRILNIIAALGHFFPTCHRVVLTTILPSCPWMMVTLAGKLQVALETASSRQRLLLNLLGTVPTSPSY